MIEKIKEIANRTTMTESEVASTLHSQAKRGLPLNLQYFSENPEGEEAPPGNEENPESGEDAPPKDVTFTQSEVDSRISKAVDSALKKQQAKLDKDIEERIKIERQEAERLAKLTEKEREKEQLTIREQELEKRAKKLERKELLSDAESTLREKELPTTFASVLLGEDANATLDNINNFKKSFDEAVNNAVKEKLRQDIPPAGTGINTKKQPSISEMAKEHRII